MDLLAHRQTPEGGLALAASGLRAGAAPHVDEVGARWVFPALGKAALGPAPSGPKLELPSAAEVGRQAERLASLKDEARARQARGFAGQASEEAHQRLRELLAEERPGGARGGRVAPERSPATAAGSAVHQSLEDLDLQGDLAAGLARARARLPDVLAVLAGGARVDEAVARSRSILDRLTGSRTLARLEAVAPYVVARELQVLLPPDDAPDAPVGFVSGTIDLVYRDPKHGELVIVDYKTDDVATDREVATRVAAYAAQGRVYRRALREALGLDRDPRFELWFLAADRIEEVPG
jgi:ATP-dependent exoDNAse (exonuclease V) beta subunit